MPVIPAVQKLTLADPPAVIEALKDDLADYVCTKGSIHLHWDRPIPEALVGRIVAYNLEHLAR